MGKDLTVSFLMDFYGQMLTEKQKEVVELYYNEDLSLAEIAEHSGITRQGVRDSIKRAEGQLREYEERLGLAEKFTAIQEELEEIVRCSKEIELFNTRYYNSREISERTGRIVELAAKLGEQS